MNHYAQDGKCHNVEPGTFNHECGKPAAWIGTNANGFHSGFCDDCKTTGHEARRFREWERAKPRSPNPSKDSARQDADIMRVRTAAHGRGATPVEIERNVMALWGVA